MNLETLCRLIFVGLGIGISTNGLAKEINILPPFSSPVVGFLQKSWSQEGSHQIDVDRDGHVDYILKVIDPQKGTMRFLCTYEQGRGPKVSSTPEPVTYQNIRECPEKGLSSKVQSFRIDATPEQVERYKYDDQGRMITVELEGTSISGNTIKSLTQMSYYSNGQLQKKEEYIITENGKKIPVKIEEWDTLNRPIKVLIYSKGTLSSGEITTYSPNNRIVDRYDRPFSDHCEITHQEYPKNEQSSHSSGYTDEGCDGKPDKCWDLGDIEIRTCIDADIKVPSPFLKIK